MYYVHGEPLRRFSKKLTAFIAALAIATNSLAVALPALLIQRAYADTESTTITPCVTTTSVFTTDLSTWDMSQTREAGHNELVADGLHIWTDADVTGSPDPRKAAGYFATDFSLSDLGTQDSSTAIDYVGTGSKPGLQLVIDLENDGVIDGILVGEGLSYPVNVNDWWFTGSKSAPRYISIFGHNGGTVDEWLSMYPDAKVNAIGYSLGSGVNGDGVIKKITLGCTEYTFGIYIPPCDTENTSFDTFSNGSVDGQNGWQVTNPNFDQEIVDNVYGFSEFGCKSFRISNAHTTGSFGDQTFSYSIANEAGETSAENGGLSGGTRQNHFEASWDFASTTPDTEQPGLNITASPDRGDGARMSWIQMADTPTGLNVNFYEYVPGAPNTGGGIGFVHTTIASGLDRSTLHNIRVTMDFIDGDDNDVVKVYVDGDLKYTGNSWEDYFRIGEGNPTRTVDSVLFRASGTAAPSNDGNGFLIDNVEITSSTIPPDTSDVMFVNSPKYVRENNVNDIVAQIVTLDTTTEARFYVDGDSTPIAGYGIGGAGATTDWWRLRTPLPAGMHTITAEVKIGGTWYPVNGSGVVYSLDLPWAEYILPSVSNHVFRPSDNPVRVKVDDQFNQFSRMIVTIDGINYEVVRANCNQAQAGNYLLCDLNTSSTWSDLSEGNYTASTTTYTLANNRKDNMVSQQFTIDGTKPTVLSLTAPSVVSNSLSATAETEDTGGQVESVNFYITVPRVSDGACTGNGIKLIEKRVMSAIFGNQYQVSLDTSSLNGEYCLTAVARDQAFNNSASVHKKITIDNIKPTVSINPVAPRFISGTESFEVIITDDLPLDPAKNKQIWVELYGDPDWSHKKGQKVDLSNGTGTFTIDTSTLPDGKYVLRVGSVEDAAGNTSGDRSFKHFTVDNTKPVINILQPLSGTVINSTSGYVFRVEASDNIELNLVDIQLRNGTGSPSGFSPRPMSRVGVSNIWEIVLDSDTVNLPDGSYMVRAHAYDKAGNFAADSETNITVDNTAPVVTVTPLAGSLLSGTVTFNITVTDDNLDSDALETWVYLYNNLPPQASKGAKVDLSTGSGSFTVDTTLLSDGLATFNVGKLYDAAGNASGIGDSYFSNYIIDNTAPAVPSNLLWTPNGGSAMVSGGLTNVQLGTLNWDDADTDVDHYRYYFWTNIPGYFEGQANAWSTEGTEYIVQSPTGGSIWTDFDDKEGVYYFCIEAIDALGNTSACSDTFSVTYDNTAPAVAIINYSAVGNVITPAVTATDANGPLTYLWTTDPDVTISDTTVKEPTFTANADGTYSFELTVTDPAGNSSLATFEFTYTTPVIPTFTPTINGPQQQTPDPADVQGVATTNTAFTNVTTTNANYQTTAVPESTTDEEETDSGEVEGVATTNFANTADDITEQADTVASSGNLLWLGWWWIPLLLVLGGLLWFLLGRGEDSEEV